MKSLLKTMLALVLLSVLSYGDDYLDAYAAYQKKDYTTAFKLYNSACENGDYRGCGVVGGMFEFGLGIQKDNQLALEYYTKACEMDNEVACKQSKRLQNKIPVCTQDELSFLNDKRYFKVSSSDLNPSIVADSKTIRIDKKNKVIQVWITWVSNQKNRDSWIQDLGQIYNNFGYMKSLEVINYANMTDKINTLTYYNCDGSIIKTANDGSWQNIVPGSVMEGITETIMKKYNLK